MHIEKDFRGPKDPTPPFFFLPVLHSGFFLVMSMNRDFRLDFKYKIEYKKEFPNLSCVPHIISYITNLISKRVILFCLLVSNRKKI